MKYFYSSLLFAVAFSFTAIAQSGNFPAIYLNNHTVQLHESKTDINLYPVNEGRYHAVLQSQTDVNSIKTLNGVKMLEYLPKNAGIFSIDAEISPLELAVQLNSINALITPVKTEWKLSKRLFNDDIPDWSWHTIDEIQVWVNYYRDLTHNAVLEKLKSAGYTIIVQNEEQSTISVAVKPAEVMKLASYSYVFYVQEKEDPGQPENYTARSDHRVNSLQPSYSGVPYYDGSGVVVGLGDDGEIGPHIDYSGRLSQSAAPSNGDHGDHVAGTIFGAGNADPKGRGMAPGADIYYQSYPNNINDADINYTSQNVRVTNSSYSNGCNAGYTLFTQRMDQDIIDNPNLLHVFSAGNNGSSDCSYGAGAGWGNVTGGHKIAKNVIAVANVTYTDNLANSSSRGPASDGRIKPDVAAVGSSVYSTTNPNLYVNKTGTSMAAPGVAGTAAVLYDAYRDYNSNQDPASGLIKAIMMNSADDLGNLGPDFRFGYGRINARKAYDIIKNQQYFNGSLSNNGNTNHIINVPNNTAQVKVMLYWSDPPATTFSALALVNDLDMEITYNGNNIKPWILDPTPLSSNLNTNAFPGRDSLNNMEQITIDNPGSGDLTVSINAFNIPMGPQSYYLVYYFEEDAPVLTYPVGGEGFVPGQTEVIRWDAPKGNTGFMLEYSSDGGLNWNTISNNIPSSRRYYSWNVPTTLSDNYLVRLSRSNVSSVNAHPFTVIGTANNIRIAQVCPDTIKLVWDPVPGATSYIIHRLGTKYMDSIGSSAATYYNIPVTNYTNPEWYSITTLINGGKGMRAKAVQSTPASLFNCTVAKDLSGNRIISPAPGLYPDCFPLASIPVKVNFTNNGINPVYNFTISYQLNGGTIVTDSIHDTIQPGMAYIHTFSGSGISLASGSSYSLVSWGNLVGDGNLFNDTISGTTTVYSATTANFPYSNAFESFSTCPTTSDCGQTNCSLGGGWHNGINGTDDDIDFRTDDGGTPSSGTGPNIDHNPGTGSGNYLYLEASGCFNNTGVLMSPCINLNNASSPILEFWYHMEGANMGTLSLDIFDGSEWHYNIMPVISGNQGNQWLKQNINLIAFAGKKVVLRFTGVTGPDFTSDIAIDDVNLIENTTAPTADFTLDNSNSCLNGVVNFTDASINVPTAWDWDIQPSTYNYVNGTDSSDQNISVQFTAIGTYQVSLIATNAFGADTILKTQVVTVDAGDILPVFEDFEGVMFPPNGWEIYNPDNQSAWKRKGVTGANGNPTKAAYFDNFNSGAMAEEDGLVTMNLDLRTITDAVLTFDVAYAQSSSTKNDSLIIDYSPNCGLDYYRTDYARGGSLLATAPVNAQLFTPVAAGEWRRDSVDLSSYAGNNIKLRFRNYSDGGNLIYIDNIQIVSGSIVAPIAYFTADEDSLICKNQPIIFTDSLSGGTPTSIHWDFGPDAIPNTATTSGPHTVNFIRTGMQTVVLTVSNAGGLSQHTFQILVKETPISVFNSTVVSPQVVQFNDMSLNDPISWLWTFGDGDSSTLQNPLHNYSSGGSYNVSLTVTNACGTTDRNQLLVISGIGLEDETGLYNMVLYPNPANGLFNLSFASTLGQKIKLEIYNTTGKLIYLKKFDARSGSNTESLDLTEFADGLYIIKVNSESGVKTLRAVKK